MAPRVSDTRDSFVRRYVSLLAPTPGRLEFSTRLALVCALTILVVEIYQTPDPALTAYLAFFLIKPDRASSIVASIVMLILITLIISTVMLLTIQVIDQPVWRVAVMICLSLGLLFCASASKLKPIANIVALIVAYALDLLGTAHLGEIATRALLYAWLFVGIPAAVCIVVNLSLGPAPRKLACRALAHRLSVCARALRVPTSETRYALRRCVVEGTVPITALLRMAAVEKTSPSNDLAALRQAVTSTAAILSFTDILTCDPDHRLPATQSERVAAVMDQMAVILERGAYPIDVTLSHVEHAGLPAPLNAALIELTYALTHFAEGMPTEPAVKHQAKASHGFFLPDAFTNPEHVQYAIKTTAAAMFCYVVYSLLDWPGIHTCLITCYIVSLGTMAETIEKLALRIVGCLIGAAAGLAAIVYLMPHVTSIGALMGIVFAVALVSAWVAGGSPRISYAGFQIAFAFLLCVVQGSSPAFDMAVARDRVIGILFGNVTVAAIFTHLWPISMARRIKPAMRGFLNQLVVITTEHDRFRRWSKHAQAQASLGMIWDDVELSRYEPSHIKMTSDTLDQYRASLNIIVSLDGWLLVTAEHEPDTACSASRRLQQTADPLEHQSAIAVTPSTSADQRPLASMVEPLLTRFEQVLARAHPDTPDEGAHYAHSS